MKRIYLAGPDVFRANNVEHFRELKALCTKYNFEGCSPLDCDLSIEMITSQIIFKSNYKLIDSCDIVLANLTQFRGDCVDDGTSWEIGYAFAKQKLICGYTPNYNIELKNATKHTDNNFPIVEDFGNCVNLMIEDSINLSGGVIAETAEDCLRLIYNIR
jgi:nucleoside 2-deoxyribosyltransferase